MNLAKETKMRYQSLESIAGKTTSDRRLNFVKLLFGIIVGHWIGQKYCHGPRCLDILESDYQSQPSPAGEMIRNLDQKFDENVNIQVKTMNRKNQKSRFSDKWCEIYR